MVDFMAITRGQRLAEQDNRADERLLRERERYDFERAGREQQWQENQWARQAAAYLAPLAGNQQRAADAGIGAAEFIIQQRQQILNDPAFQSMPSEVQSQVINRLRETALLTAQQAQQQGDTSLANRLVQEFGNFPVASAYDQAVLTGDVQRIVEAANQQFGSNAIYNADGTVTVNGMTMPGHEFARQVALAGSPLGGLTAMSQQAAAQRAQEDRELALRMAGYTQTPDGQWVWGAGPSNVPAPTAVGSDVTRAPPQSAPGYGVVTQQPAAGAGEAPPSIQRVAEQAAAQARATEDARLGNPAEWMQSLGRLVPPPPFGPAAAMPRVVMPVGSEPAAQAAPTPAPAAAEPAAQAPAITIGNQGPFGRPGIDPAADPYLQQRVGPSPETIASMVPAAQTAAAVVRPSAALNALVQGLNTPAWLSQIAQQLESDPGSGLGSSLRQLRGTSAPQQSGVQRAADEVSRLRNQLARNLMEQSRPSTSARRRQQLVAEARKLREQIQEQQ